MTKKYKLTVIFVLLISFHSFIGLGPRVAVDYHFAYTEILKGLFDIPFLWSEKWGNGLGYYVNTLWAWPYEVLFGLGGKLGFSFPLLVRIFGVLPVLVIGYLGIGKILESLKISGLARAVGTVFYLTNTYILLLIDGGQINLSLTYALFPWSFYLFEKVYRSFSLANVLKFSLVVLLISSLDLRVLFLLGILLLVFLVTEMINSKLELINLLKTILFSAVFLAGFHAYWLVPVLLVDKSLYPANFLSAGQVTGLSFASLGHSILLQQPHWFKNIFGRVENLSAGFILLPILVFIAPILYPKNKKIAFWTIVALLGIFLAKGTNPPFGGINLWIFEKLPGFAYFRDPTKFFFLVALPYSILMALSVQAIFKLNWRFRIFPLLVLVYLLWLSRPIILNQMTGLFSEPPFLKVTLSLNKVIKDDKSFGRMLWLPAKIPLGFEDYNHPAVDGSMLSERRPFALGTKGIYETLNFLRESSFSGELLDVAGISAIVYPPLDLRRSDPHPDVIHYYNTFLGQLKNLSWVAGLDNQAQMPLIRTKQHQDRFFLTRNLWWVIGSDDIYNEAVMKGMKLKDNAFVFVEEYQVMPEIENFPFAKIVLNKRKDIDLAADFIPREEILFPARNLKSTPNASGWWKKDGSDFLGWKDFMMTKYGFEVHDFDMGGGWAIAEGNLELRTKGQKINSGQVLLARVLESTRSGEIRFIQGSKLIGSIDTNNDTNVRWFEVGKTKSSEELSIVTKGDINVVSALVIVNQDYWKVLKKRAANLIDTGRVSDLSESKSSAGKLQITRVNPTKYKVKISELSNPGFLVFSESFDKAWKLNGRSSVPVYSLLNGFRVDKDGEYIIEYSTQKLVPYGLSITLLTLLLLGFLYYYSKGVKK